MAKHIRPHRHANLFVAALVGGVTVATLGPETRQAFGVCCALRLAPRDVDVPPRVMGAPARARFMVFYLLSGLAAALLQVALEPTAVTPMVGASGAISGVMGGYLLLYPTARVFTFVPVGFFVMSVALPAWTMLVYWFVLQLLGGVTVIAGAQGGGVAFWAHVGGFVAGLVLVKVFARGDYVRTHRARRYRPQLDRAA